MKKYLFTLILIGATISIQSQNVDLNNSTDYVRVKKNGSSIFSRAFGLNSSNHLYIGSVEETIGNIYFFNKGTNHLMTLKADGNVGIGTTNPLAKLHIEGPTNSSSYFMQMANRFKFRGDGVLNWGSASAHGILSWDTGRAILGAQSANDLSLNANGNEKIRVKTNGNVGIGTTSPDKKLEVNGDILLRNSTGIKQIYTWSPTDSNWRIGMNDNPGFTRSLATSHVQFIAYGHNTNQGFAVGRNGQESSFEIGGPNHTAFFRGNVGIGTTTPTAKLEITKNSSTEAVGLRLTNSGWSSNMSTSLEFKTGSQKSVPTSKISSIMNGSGNAGDRLGFFVQENGINPNNNPLVEKLSLLPNGNVGIGTTNPQAKLEVDGDNNAIAVAQTAYGWNDSNLIGAEYAAWDASRTHAAGTYFYRWTGTSDVYHAGYVGQEQNSNSWGLAFKTDVKNSKTHATTTRMFINTSGDIGIGTTNPNGWKLAVNGNIRAKEIKVETGWSDFVFENNYELPTLDEVEQHIKTKGHLKDIPSAKEVAENGILLGEMDSKLLQKIEELTLYTIDQEKNIKAYKNELLKQKKVNEDLEERLKRLEKAIEKSNE